jgi:ADP-heptose:LPS heptosyltransferase
VSEQRGHETYRDHGTQRPEHTIRGGHGDSPPRLLALRALGIGDLLAAVPALRGLRDAFRQYETVLAAPRSLAPLAALSGAVDRLLPASAPDRRVPHRLDWRGPPPSIAVDLHGNGPPSHRLLTALGPRRVLAFAHPETPAIRGPEWHAEEHERDRWCRLLAHYGIPADPDDLRLPHPGHASPVPGAVLVHPGAEAPSRRWPVRRWAEVINALRAAGADVVVTGGPREEQLLAETAALARPPGLAIRCAPPLPELAALVADASAVLSGDTGVAHLAVAYGTPSVTLFGPVSPRLWGPPHSRRHRVLWHPGPPGDPHGGDVDPLLLRITPDEVMEAYEELRTAPEFTTRQPDRRPTDQEPADRRPADPHGTTPHGTTPHGTTPHGTSPVAHGQEATGS